MKRERLLLIPFFGNYIINNVVAAIISLIPASQSTSIFTPQYIGFIILAAISVGLFAWWYLYPLSRMEAIKWGLIFGVAGFIISILTTFVSGVSGVLLQTGSLSQMVSVLPNFGPFLWNISTVVLLGYWVIPSVIVGWLLSRSMRRAAPPATSM